MDAARELGYRPNAIARSLISGRSRMIGLLAAYLDNPFYASVLERLARALQARNYHTLLFMSGARRSRSSITETVGLSSRRRSDGIGNPVLRACP